MVYHRPYPGRSPAAGARRGATPLAAGLVLRLALLVALLAGLTPATSAVIRASSEAPPPIAQGTATGGAPGTPPTYQDLLALYQRNGDRPAPEDARVVIDAARTTSDDGNGYRREALAGAGHPVLIWTNEDGWAQWDFVAPATGLYALSVRYEPVPGKDASAQRALLIDGALPFAEARRIAFERIWANGGPVTQDNQGNDVRPPQVERPAWVDKLVDDADGTYREPFLFYLTQGEHTLRLEAVREPIALDTLTFEAPSPPQPYAQVLAGYRARGYREATRTVVVQGEDPGVVKSDPTIRAEACFDPACQPYTFAHFRLNFFGGFRWRKGEQSVTWTLDIPEDGLYTLGFKVLENYTGRLPSYRELRIDGRVPFQEAEELPFRFDLNWQDVVLGDGAGHPYLFYLTRGRHTLTLTAKVGPIRQGFATVTSVAQRMSEIERQIVMITGANPDPNLEYHLEEKIPNLVPTLSAMAAQLEAQIATLTEIAGGRPDSANQLEAIAEQLRSMAANPDSISTRVGDLENSEQSLSQWLLDVQSEPLGIDYFMLMPPGAKMPPAESPLLERAWFSLASFVGSFFFNYTGVGSVYTPSPAHPVLDVWEGRGQEWGLVLKELIETDFTPKTGIRVNLHVFPPSALSGGSQSVLLLSASSGQTPDVALAVGPETPVEFAIRKAIVNLDEFPEYPQVAQRFRPGALIQYHYPAGSGGGDYALPETQNFTMLFYRTDILQQLGLRPPDTWQDVYDMLPVLQQHGMDFYFQGGQTPGQGLAPFLFQHGGAFYTPDGTRSALDSPQALEAFKQWTGLYTDYRMPIQANFYSRFRTGEIPVGVAGYNEYILLSTAAPELLGRWAMLPMPGTKMPDGRVNRSAGGSGEADVIFSASRHQQEAWQFLSWWTSAPVQQRYATELEALLGVEARWNTSNVEALRSLPWPQQDIKSIFEQWQWFQEQPVVLGGYFSQRHISNAWNRVVLQGDNPREALEQAVKDINRELIVKQVEFGLRPPSAETSMDTVGGPLDAAPPQGGAP